MSELNAAEQVQRGDRAKQAIEEFFDPALRHVHTVFERRLKEVCASEPWATDKIAALANVLRITAEIGADIEAYIYEGEAARRNLIKVEKYEQMSPARRRYINIAPV